jgi:hypothetical protein
MVDDTLKPCCWNESGYTRIMIAEFGFAACCLLLVSFLIFIFIFFHPSYHRLQRISLSYLLSLLVLSFSFRLILISRLRV